MDDYSHYFNFDDIYGDFDIGIEDLEDTTNTKMVSDNYDG